MLWRSGFLPCPHCCHPYAVLAVWRGARESCVRCGGLLRPGTAERIVHGDQAVDRIRCPWCGAVQLWTALERIGMEERPQRVRYTCPDCLRPFTVEHDPTAPAQVSVHELNERERAWLAFVRWLARRDGR